jgi:GR25 family glycosyltransferase involved in LPS biosynthesis
MIVKNEAHIITKTFDNLLENFTFDYYVICDTGSTDDSIQVIQSYFKSKSISGEILQHEWKNFGHNRTLALKSAYNKTDYLLIFDADDSISGSLKSCLPKKLTADKYQLVFGPGVSYTRPLLVNNRKHWKFVGVLHEYLTADDSMQEMSKCKSADVILTGGYNIISGRSGARSKNVNKYADDAEVLRKAILTESDEMLRCRYIFYCAQSYRDAGRHDEAIAYYTKCMNSEKSWLQERWVSCNELGKLHLMQKKTTQALAYFLKTTQFDEERIEGIVCAVQILFLQENYYFIEALYHQYRGYKTNVINKLFIDTNAYSNVLESYYACALLHIGKYAEGFSLVLKLKLNHKLSLNNAEKILMFRTCALYSKNAGQYSEALFKEFSSLCDTVPYEDSFIQIWMALFEQERKRLTRYSLPNFPKESHPKKNGIILTFTTCKRFDLFKQTVNSILNVWTDLHRINYWFCVDDNSDDTDRKSMKLCYPWIEFYYKTEAEKGHRTSMNIIYDKLMSLKNCTYWIHIEDDFVFYKKMNYIEHGIAGFSAFPGQQVKQVLFNKNYAETIENYKCVSTGKPSSDGAYFLHNHAKNTIGISHDYWPGYSFRPSIIIIDAIRQLKNYDSPNAFFERDYADKWHAFGFKCAFFNTITSIHIGKLCNQPGKNAYDLNKETQFNTKHINKININTMNAKVINLRRREDRRLHMKTQLQTHNNYEFIPAIDLREPENNKLFSNKFLSEMFYGNDFNNRTSIIGCALSHFSLWNQLINSKDEYYLIYEDDIKLNKSTLEVPITGYDFLFLGYLSDVPQKQSDCENYVFDSNNELISLNKQKYVGGFHSYIITKHGASVILDFIKNNGIKHGIDYLIKIVPGLICYTFAQLYTTVDWTPGQICADTDIQNSFEMISLQPQPQAINKFEFFQGLDILDNDLFYNKINNEADLEKAKQCASKMQNCAGFNSLGFYKSKIDIASLRPSQYFSAKDGIYIKLQ